MTFEFFSLGNEKSARNPEPGLALSGKCGKEDAFLI